MPGWNIDENPDKMLEEGYLSCSSHFNPSPPRYRINSQWLSITQWQTWKLLSNPHRFPAHMAGTCLRHVCEAITTNHSPFSPKRNKKPIFSLKMWSWDKSQVAIGALPLPHLAHQSPSKTQSFLMALWQPATHNILSAPKPLSPELPRSEISLPSHMNPLMGEAPIDCRIGTLWKNLVA